MPKNPFLAYQQYEPKQKRNSFDLSHYNNATYKLGYLYPNLVQEVNFGDSVRIGKNTAMGFRTFPMVFPIQTPLMVKQYYFYVRNRIIWKDWEDFIFNNKEVVHPYISRPRNDEAIFGTGGLGDHLGIPTTVVSDGIGRRSLPIVPISSNPSDPDAKLTTNPILAKFDGTQGADGVSFSVVSQLSNQSRSTNCINGFDFWTFNDGKFYVPSSVPVGFALFISSPDKDIYDSQCVAILSINSHESGIFDVDNINITYSYSPSEIPETSSLLVQDSPFTSATNRAILDSWKLLGINFYLVFYAGVNNQMPTFFKYSFSYEAKAERGIYDIAVNSNFNPYFDQVQLNALPFRAYEAIYRSYFQDLINEPFIIDGEQQFNRYVTNMDSGADSTDYHLFQRNWEADFLTTARPTPQQGLAPLIGITSRGDVRLEREDGGEYTVRVTTDENGLINGVEQGSSSGNSDQRIRLTLLELTTSGISINSLRETNALQRWLEDNIRRGVKYKDQVLAQTGVRIRYDELDMPEFIGGYSTPINVNSIYQTSASQDDGDFVQPLGNLAGTATSFGKQGHDITHYCDESGFIIGIMCIVPQPIYSQLLPKMFLRQSPLDYYNPKFGHLGMQPISYKEVCPVQAYVEDYPLDNVFGYQRPWYDLLQSVDTAHGQMRTTMHNFLMNRYFSQTPELGADFLHIDPSQVNDVFTITDESGDTVFGQTYFEIYKKQAIPRFGIPRIEA